MKQLFAGQSGKAEFRLVDNILGWVAFYEAAFAY